MTKREQIETLLKEVLYNSLAQAIIKIFLSPFLLIKVVLFLFVLGSIGCTSYLVISSIMTYFTYGVVASSRTLYETPTLFPKVTFCNYNFFTTKYGYDVIQSGKNIYIDYFSTEEKKRISRDLDEILLECTFNLKSCNSSDFVWSYDPINGNCFTFNSGFDSNGNKVVLKDSMLSGFYYGLRLTLYVNIYEKILETGYFKKVSNELGAYFLIGNSSHLKYDEKNGIRASPGFGTNIMIDREFKSILPKPYSNCDLDSSFETDSDLFNLILKSKYQYSQQLCITQCFQKYLITKYNCTGTSIVNIFNLTKECNIDDKVIQLYQNTSFISDLFTNICFPLCPLECNQTLFKSSISTTLLVGDKYLSRIKNSNLATDFINRTIDATTIEKSLVKVNIFYESLSYTDTIESPQMNMVSLLGSIGGNLGLFLGVSVFSLGEIIEVLIEIYFISKKSF